MNAPLRNWLIFGGILAVTFALAMTMAHRYQASQLSQAPTSLSAAPSGTKAAFATLERLRLPVERWQHPWTKLSQAGLLIYADLAPDEVLSSREAKPPTTEEERFLARWIARGNTLLLFANPHSALRKSVPTLLKELEIGSLTNSVADEVSARTLSELYEPQHRQMETLRGVMPTSFTAGIGLLDVEQHPGLRPDPGAFVPVITGPDATVNLLWLCHGRGNVLIFSSASFVDNEFLAHKDNLALLLNIVSRFSQGGAIMFDEYHHGLSQEFAFHDFLAMPMVKLAAAQLALVIGLLIFSQWRHFGAPIPLVRETRRSVMEYAVSLGDLYSRAERQLETLDYLYQHARRELIDRHGLRANATSAEIATRLTNSHKLQEQWDRLARACEQHLHAPKLTRKEFGRLAAEIQEFRRQMQ
jgi:hypothetical protein